MTLHIDGLPHIGSLDEARNQLATLRDEIALIDKELGQRKREQPQSPDYHTWRAQALVARDVRLRELRTLKDAIAKHLKDLRATIFDTTVDPTDPISLLGVAYLALRSLGKRLDNQYTKDEEAAMNAVRDYRDQLANGRAHT